MLPFCTVTVIGFNTQPPEGGWAPDCNARSSSDGFNTQPPEGGWGPACGCWRGFFRFNTQPPEGGWHRHTTCAVGRQGFNTQPPEGGWEPASFGKIIDRQFQHTAARRRLVAVGTCVDTTGNGFNTQPPEGGWLRVSQMPKRLSRFQHTAARRRLGFFCLDFFFDHSFQHTAARRRLEVKLFKSHSVVMVSTHSRPKAAGSIRGRLYIPPIGFNTQPPEGGWHSRMTASNARYKFQHTAARRRLEQYFPGVIYCV